MLSRARDKAQLDGSGSEGLGTRPPKVVSTEGHRYELTWRPALTGSAWRVRHQTAATGSGATVARTHRFVDH